MLYLNQLKYELLWILVNYLTLTSVVFEYLSASVQMKALIDLTLTSVVFEFCFVYGILFVSADLTLTSVVFEFK